MNAIKGLIAFVMFFLVIIGFFFLVSGGNVINISATVEGDERYMYIEIDRDNVDFGSVSKNRESREKVCINNTGTEDVVITPVLNESSTDEFFDYIYVKVLYAGDSTFKRVGEFNVTINKNSDKCIWFNLNLSDYPYPLYEGSVNIDGQVIVRAMPIV